MKVSEILSTYEAFKELGEKELPFEAALNVAENLEILRIPAETAIKKRSETMSKYLMRDEKGNPIKVGEDAYKLTDSDAYMKDMTELSGKEVKVGELKAISKSVFDGMNIKPSKLAPILKYIE